VRKETPIDSNSVISIGFLDNSEDDDCDWRRETPVEEKKTATTGD